MEVLWISLLLIRCVISASVCNSFLPPASDTDPVRCMKPEPDILGGNITLTCTLPHPVEAIHVIWCEIKGNAFKELASCSKEHGPRIPPEFATFISILPLDPDEDFYRSTIEISKWEKKAEACYGCYFSIKHANGVYGEVFLTDIGLSNELACSAPGTDINITMNPLEIKTQKSERDVNGNSLLKGRFSDPNANASCIFVSREAGGEKTLKEGSDEMVVLQCNATGTEISQINWNRPGNSVGETNKTIEGNVTTITSSLQIPLSSLTPDQRVSCNVNHATEGNPDKMEAVRKWYWAPLAIAVVVTAFAFYIWMKHKSKGKTSKDESQLKNTEETPIKVPSENRDETPEKDFGGKRPENDGLLNPTNGYSPRKLEFA
ncbi:uncharacterized protein LOC143981771 [Lithobates pipiens]